MWSHEEHSMRARPVHHEGQKHKKSPTLEGLVHHIWWTSIEPKLGARQKLTALKRTAMVIACTSYVVCLCVGER